MQAEIDALQANHTWVMTPLPPSKLPIGYMSFEVQTQARWDC